MEKTPLPQDRSRFGKLAKDTRATIKEDAPTSLDFLSTAELVAPSETRASDEAPHSLDLEIAAMRAKTEQK